MKKMASFVLLFSILIIANLHAQQPVYSDASSLDVSFYKGPTDHTPYPRVPAKNVKNIILLIGDGMGLAQINGARIRAVGADGFLHIDRMPVTGFLRTHAENALITDSASSATAYATGKKTNNGMIAVTPDSQKIYTVLEGARDMNKSTGLVATSSVTHATPASFAAHVPSRQMARAIAKDMVDTKVNVVLGGGKKYFVPDPADTLNQYPDLVKKAEDMGYKVIDTRDELLNATSDRLFGFFKMGHLNTQAPEPSIAEMTQKAIEILSKDQNGFFLMVEGSQIDWGSHDNDPIYTFRQMLLFDEAIKAAMDFALADGNTLVIITADHETGGLTINGGLIDGSKLTVGWTTGGHTGINIPVFAFGPHAERFMGIHDNTFVGLTIAELFGIKPFPKVTQAWSAH